MKKLSTRILACCLTVMMMIGLLATTAFAAENDPGDTYFSISESGSTQKYYGSILLGDPVMTLEPDKIYHLELQWTFHSIDEAVETAKYVAMSFEYPRQCLKDRMYDFSADVYSSVVNSTCIVLSFWAGDNIEIEDVAGSYRIYCDDLQDGSIADVYGLDLGWDHEISVGDLANGHSCRLTFDIHTKSFVPTTGNQGADTVDPADQNGTNSPDGVTDPDSEAATNSGTTSISNDEAWNSHIPVIIVSVIITLLVIVVIIAMLDVLARRFRPNLRSLPIIRHCMLMSESAKPSKQENTEEISL